MLTLYILYKYHNYGRLSESKEVMGIYLTQATATRLADKYGWTIEVAQAGRIRVDGGPFGKDKWVAETELVTPEQKQVLKDLNLWRNK